MNPAERPPESAPPVEAPLGGRMMRGAIWMVAMRWTMRSVGLVSTAILARVLTPEDFGVVAMAMVVYALTDTLQDFGIDLALIRIRHVEMRHYRTAWTFAVIAGIGCGAILLLVAPFIGTYFRDDRVPEIMILLSLLLVLNGLASIRTVDFRRNLDFGREFRFQVIGRLIGTVSTITLAFYLRSYWALILGMLSGGVATCVASYVMAPFRPVFSFGAARELISFSGWIQVRSILGVASSKIDQLAIGRLVGADQLGGYHLSREITLMVASEVLQPLGRTLMPGYARLLDDRPRLQRAFLKVFTFYVQASLPLGVGLFLVASDVVPLLLGQQWLHFIPLFQIFALAAIPGAIGGAAGPLLMATGHVRALAIIAAVDLALATAMFAAILVVGGGLEALAWGRVAHAILITAVYIGVSLRVVDFGAGAALGLCLRPCCAAGLMILAVTAVSDLGVGSAWASLGLKVTCGAAVYGVALLGLWLAAGRPDGTERDLVDVALDRLGAALRNRA